MFSRRGGFRLFKAFGIEVSLDPWWILAAVYLVQAGRDQYSSLIWSIWELLALFSIVLLHEFGHALACRSVGGRANRIVLWPLGGVAFVDPPSRPGPTLWSIAAGPLVNVLLVPVTYFAAHLARDLFRAGIISTDAVKFVYTMRQSISAC